MRGKPAARVVATGSTCVVGPVGSRHSTFVADKWLKIADYPDISFAVSRELVVVAKRLRKEGFPNTALKRGF